MSLGIGLSGVNANTPNYLVLDSGILYKNIDIDAIRFTNDINAAVAGATMLGATRGGATFSTNKESRQVEIDGLRYPIKGLERIDMYSPQLQVTLIEINRDNLGHLMGSYDRTLWGSYEEFSPRLIVEDNDYIENVALFATVAGAQKEIVVVLKNALMIEGMEMPFEDKNELAIQCTFVGHATPQDYAESPFLIFHPDIGGAPAS